MKQIRMLLAVLLLSVAASAQVRVAFTGGLHSASVDSFWNPQPFANHQMTMNRFGVHFGLLAKIPFAFHSQLSFQPGILYSAKGATQEQLFDQAKTPLLRYANKQSINYIDLPFNLAYALPLTEKTSFFFGGGPQASLFYTGKTYAATIDTFGTSNINEQTDLPVGKNQGQFKLMHYGLNAFAGFEFGRVFLRMSYAKGLMPYYADEARSYKHKTVGATLGIYIGQLWEEEEEEAPQEKAVKVNQKKDTDKDGVPDYLDWCPGQAGPELTMGCPDTDGDGIADKFDQCPNEKGTSNEHGCPVYDRDKDGIKDKLDQCPDVAGLEKYKGCPAPDSDQDGVNDEEDKCPAVAGTKENKGCPNAAAETEKKKEVAKEIVDKVAYAAKRIQFETGKAILLKTSLPVLDEIVSLFQQYPDLRITIEGHTSAEGNPDTNQQLSEQRAQSVRSYLISKGISARRLVAVGFGSRRPINEGKTEAEKAANRRVELKLSY